MAIEESNEIQYLKGTDYYDRIACYKHPGF